MGFIKPIKRALGKFAMFASGDYVHYDSLGSGGSNSGLKVLLDNGTFVTPSSGNLVYSNTAASTAITANGVETTFTVPSYSIPANSLVAGSIIRLKMWGVYTTAGIAPTINIKVKLGGTTYLATGAITAITGVTNGGWFGDVVFTIYTIGAAGTVDAQAYGEFSTALTTGLSVNVPNAATQVLDTTASQAVTVTATWGQASCSIQIRGAAIYIDNLSTLAAAGAFPSISNYNAQLAAYNTLMKADLGMIATSVAGTYYLVAQANTISTTGGGTTSGNATVISPQAIYIASADYPSVNGLAPKLRIRASIFVNATAPTGNYTFGLYPITAPGSAGGAGLRSHTIGTLVSGSNGATQTAPAANTNYSLVGSDFALPADGWYAICILTTATVANNSLVQCLADLQISYK